MKIKSISAGHFYGKTFNKKHYPIRGLLELTYRCSLNCIHCYCKGSDKKNDELDTKEWQEILTLIQKEGCLYLDISGGDPLIRKDFLQIYSYAKKKGFIINIFTNGQLLNQEILDYFGKFPPYSIEITLNGITEATYESITMISGSFNKVMASLIQIKKRNIPLILKTNCLKRNKKEIHKIESFVDGFLGKIHGKIFFSYDSMILPRINGDTSPCTQRINFRDLIKMKSRGQDMEPEDERGWNHQDSTDLSRESKFLYRCTSWKNQFFINPYGRLKFCQFSDKFSVDLKNNSFREGFYKVFPKIQDVEFKTKSKCRDCRLRADCYWCPARAYLETGNEEVPVKYYCQLAKATAKEMEICQKGSKYPAFKE
jgi:radical SAM protein with 4Fe4S-binding SPASM domain